MIKERPRQTILNGLDKSKNLYIQLQRVIQNDPNIESTFKEKLKDLDILKKRIKEMPLEDLKELLRDSL